MQSFPWGGKLGTNWGEIHKQLLVRLSLPDMWKVGQVCNYNTRMCFYIKRKLQKVFHCCDNECALPPRKQAT